MAQFTPKRLIKEPLFHFLIIGFLLFLLYDFKQGRLNEAPDRIVVSENTIEKLSTRLKLSRLHPPRVKERTALIENYIRGEVCYRKALATYREIISNWA